MAQFTISDGSSDGAQWILDLGMFMIPEALELKKFTGLGPHQWIDALGDDDPLAVRFAFYLARKRAGEDELTFGEVDVNLFGMSITPVPEEADAINADPGVTEDNAAVVPTGPVAEPIELATT